MLANTNNLGLDSVAAQEAPIGVLLWPVREARYAPNYTLAEIQVRRNAERTWVTWVYESGATRDFAFGERVAVRVRY